MPFSKSQFEGMSRKELTSYLSRSKASPDSKERYQREWRRYNQDSQESGPRKTVTHKPSKSRIVHHRDDQEPEPGEKRTVKFRAANESKFNRGRVPDYPISKKRLDVSYDTAKEDFSKYDAKTKQRYWRAWQQRREEVRPADKQAQEYRIILKVTAEADGKKIHYFSSIVANKRRLNAKDLKALAEDLDAGTNVKVLKVSPYNTSDNWTGQKR